MRRRTFGAMPRSGSTRSKWLRDAVTVAEEDMCGDWDGEHVLGFPRFTVERIALRAIDEICRMSSSRTVRSVRPKFARDKNGRKITA